MVLCYIFKVIYCILLFCFVLFLCYLYEVSNNKINSKDNFKSGKELIGKKVTVYVVDNKYPYRCLCLLDDSIELYCKSDTPVKLNEIKTIINFENNIYII